jgi:hypothetical protein
MFEAAQAYADLNATTNQRRRQARRAARTNRRKDKKTKQSNCNAQGTESADKPQSPTVNKATDTNLPATSNSHNTASTKTAAEHMNRVMTTRLDPLRHRSPHGYYTRSSNNCPAKAAINTVIEAGTGRALEYTHLICGPDQAKCMA